MVFYYLEYNNKILLWNFIKLNFTDNTGKYLNNINIVCGRVDFAVK